MATHWLLWSSYCHMASEPPRQLRLIIILSMKRDHAFFIHPPSPQQHIQDCWQPLKEKTLKSCSTTIPDGDIKRQLRRTGKKTKHGVRRSTWVHSQPPPLAWPMTSNFQFSHVKAPSIIQRTNRVFNQCLLIHVCPQLCANHDGKGPQKVQRSGRPSVPQGAHNMVVSASSQPKASIFSYSQ